MIKQYRLLGILILLDVIITITAVKYFGATELNPLFHPFSLFIIIKIILSIICLLLIYLYQENKYVQYAGIMSILIYVVVTINNLWQTANYLYH